MGAQAGATAAGEADAKAVVIEAGGAAMDGYTGTGAPIPPARSIAADKEDNPCFPTIPSMWFIYFFSIYSVPPSGR